MNTTQHMIPGGSIAARFLMPGNLFYRKDVLCRVRPFGEPKPAGWGRVQVQVDVEDGTVRTLDITGDLHVQLMDEVTLEEFRAHCGPELAKWL